MLEASIRPRFAKATIENRRRCSDNIRVPWPVKLAALSRSRGAPEDADQRLHSQSPFSAASARMARRGGDRVAEQRLGGDRLAGTLITADFFYSKKPLVIRRRRR